MGIEKMSGIANYGVVVERSRVYENEQHPGVQVRRAWVSTSLHVCPCGQYMWGNFRTRLCIYYVCLMSLGGKKSS